MHEWNATGKAQRSGKGAAEFARRSSRSVESSVSGDVAVLSWLFEEEGEGGLPRHSSAKYFFPSAMGSRPVQLQVTIELRRLRLIRPIEGRIHQQPAGQEDPAPGPALRKRP